MSEQSLWILFAALSGLLFLGMCGMWLSMRRKFVDFTEKIGDSMDCLIDGKELPQFFANEERLDSKLLSKLFKLQNITNAALEENLKQKKEIQKMVSDISHQLKTPIANITMYQDTILNNNLPKEKVQEFLLVMQSQVEKLQFLVQALVKMSRLENNLIALNMVTGNLNECVREAVCAVQESANQKQIQIDTDLSCEIMLCFDSKWTQEALLNILDNAVKYTNPGGLVRVSLMSLEMFVKIVIEDTGIGIEKEHFGDIFKRFYRESRVSRQPGIGIGLYLSRNIIMNQGGYMKVSSVIQEGSRFEVYLPKSEKLFQK